MMCIKYQNVIDAGNRMQISFILNALKKHHGDIYRDLYQQLQGEPEWRKWKEMRMNDRKINDLRQQIARIRSNEEALRCKKSDEQKIGEMQRDIILNLAEAQSATIQRYGLSLERVCSELGRNEDTMRRANGYSDFAVDQETK